MTYESSIPSGVPVIDDAYSSVGNDDLLSPTNKGKGFVERDLEEQPFGEPGARMFTSAFPVLSKPEIAEWVERRESQESQIYHILQKRNVPCKDQENTNYCWSFGVTGGVEDIIVLSGSPYESLSPASVAAPLTGYRNIGGWGEQATKGMLVKESPGGLVPSAHWPDTWWRNDEFDTPETREMRKRRAAIEFWEFDWRGPQIMEQIATAVLNHISVAVGFSWWRHLVRICGVLIIDQEIAWMIRNSWGSSWGNNGFGILKGRKARPDGATAIRVMVPS